MTRPARAAALPPLLILFAAAAGFPGCGRGGSAIVPATVVGESCAACGMEIRNPRYAAVRVAAGVVRPYDSIECAVRDAGAIGEAARGTDAGALYLADYESGALHRADSLWVVRARIPSPMGGGLAAFLDRAEAERIAAAREGTVSTAEALLGGATGAP